MAQTAAVWKKTLSFWHDFWGPKMLQNPHLNLHTLWWHWTEVTKHLTVTKIQNWFAEEKLTKKKRKKEKTRAGAGSLVPGSASCSTASRTHDRHTADLAPSPLSYNYQHNNQTTYTATVQKTWILKKPNPLGFLRFYWVWVLLGFLHFSFERAVEKPVRWSAKLLFTFTSTLDYLKMCKLLNGH